MKHDKVEGMVKRTAELATKDYLDSEKEVLELSAAKRPKKEESKGRRVQKGERLKLHMAVGCG